MITQEFQCICEEGGFEPYNRALNSLSGNGLSSVPLISNPRGDPEAITFDYIYHIFDATTHLGYNKIRGMIKVSLTAQREKQIVRVKSKREKITGKTLQPILEEKH